MTLGDRILFARRKAAKSQGDVGAQLGVTGRAVSSWETGKANPTVANLPVLAEALGVTSDWLLTGREPVGS